MKCIEDEIPFEVSEGWEWCRVRDVASVKGGKRLPKGMSFSLYKTSHAYIRVTDMKNHTINTDDLKYISEDVFLKLKNYTISKDDLYVTIAGTIGVTGEVPAELDGMNLTENAAKVTNIQINKSFLCLLLQSEFVQQQFKGKTHQVAMPKLALERILSTLIPVCSTETQIAIVKRFWKIDQLIGLISKEKDELTDTVSKTKSKILDLAIRGQLVPQDPNDETASVLLEHIRAEKEKLIKQGKIKRDKKESIIFKGEDNSYYEKVGNEVKNIDGEIPFELPDGWGFVRLKELWKLISGRDLSPSEYNTDGVGIPYITGASNFINGKVELVRWTTSPQVITKTGDLLLTCKGTIGEMAFNNFGDAHIARQIMAIRNTFDLNPEYLALCMVFHINAIKNAAKGLIPGISREDILNLILPVPPRAYQARVVKQMVMVTSFLTSIEKSLR